jgi:hypothetical protein
MTHLLITDMETGTRPHYLLRLFGAIIKALVMVFLLPLGPAFLLTLSVPSTLALIMSTLVIEYGAAPVGIGLGLPPLFVFYVLVCVAMGLSWSCLIFLIF